jgi:uncharacterized protein (TIGR03546 family)
MRRIWNKQPFFIKKRIVRLLRADQKPGSIATGMALGILIGFTPFVGLHIIAGLLLAWMIGCNKLATMAGANITNPLTMPFIYGFTFWVGQIVIPAAGAIKWPQTIQLAEWNTFLHSSPLIFQSLIAGGFIIGIPGAIIAYLLTYKIVSEFQMRKLRRINLPASIMAKKIKKVS